MHKSGYNGKKSRTASYMQISYYEFHASNTEGTHHIWANDVALAADAEFESTLSESKSDVLPLHQSAILLDKIAFLIRSRRDR